MTNLTINNKARTIEMTKKFEKAASRFGSDEYKMLQEARKDEVGRAAGKEGRLT